VLGGHSLQELHLVGYLLHVSVAAWAQLGQLRRLRKLLVQSEQVEVHTRLAKDAGFVPCLALALWSCVCKGLGDHLRMPWQLCVRPACQPRSSSLRDTVSVVSLLVLFCCKYCVAVINWVSSVHDQLLLVSLHYFGPDCLRLSRVLSVTLRGSHFKCGSERVTLQGLMKPGWLRASWWFLQPFSRICHAMWGI
jgi:hypothetical protein